MYIGSALTIEALASSAGLPLLLHMIIDLYINLQLFYSISAPGSKMKDRTTIQLDWLKTADCMLPNAFKSQYLSLGLHPLELCNSKLKVTPLSLFTRSGQQKTSVVIVPKC